MKVLFAASEAHPFIKTGGLGDVMGALPQSLANLGVDARVVINIVEFSNINIKMLFIIL